MPPLPAVLSVLHVDDDPFEREHVRALLAGDGPRGAPRLAVRELAGGALPAGPALARELARRPPDVLLLDLHLGGAELYDGLGLVPLCRRLAPAAAIVVLSSLVEAAAVEAALALPVDDFVAKDAPPSELRRVVVEACARRLAAAQPPGAGAEAPRLAAGRTLRALRARIPGLVASAVSGVHLRGETGTGKEVVAALFREAVGAVPFLSVNCGAIPAGLLESSLFGAAKGAFTGATADRRGYLEAASGGWLFLDETQCLSAAAQAALLRALENQEIFRVGEAAPRRVAVRLLSATNEDLAQLVRAGRFRHDLWQRLAEVELELPPLRERPDEIPELLDHLLGTLPGGPYRLTSAARRLLCDQPWAEGNVRQLRNCLRAMTERHADGLLTPRAVPEQYRRQAERRAACGWPLPVRPGVPGAGTTHATPLGEAAPGAFPWSAAPGAPTSHATPLGEAVPGARPRPAASPGPPLPPGLLLPLPAGFGSTPGAYARLEGALFVEAVKALGRMHGPLPLRELANRLGLSKSAVARRLRASIDSGLTSPAELAGATRSRPPAT